MEENFHIVITKRPRPYRSPCLSPGRPGSVIRNDLIKIERFSSEDAAAGFLFPPVKLVWGETLGWAISEGDLEKKVN